MRSSGILLPLSSLPSPYGIGCAGRDAYAFIDFLKAAGQRYWQILPLGPTGYGDSPYQSFSAFAGSPYYVDLEELEQRGLLTAEELSAADFGADPGRVNYGLLFAHRFDLLRLAASRMGPQATELQAFFEQNADWLEDYALFMAIKEERGQVGFQRWPAALRTRQPRALNAARRRLQREVFFWKAVQYLFFDQWTRLKSYANRRGIRIIGDLPIYVSADSADLWANGALFQIDQRGRPTEVAGVPPDAFSDEGQLWGNPLYDWKTHKKQEYRWWLRRLEVASRLYDLVRIDHFRGFEGYYAIPARAKNAVHGRWKKGPGMDFVTAIKTGLPELGIIAEDLGLLTPAVRRLLAASGFPGMKVLQFAFDPSGKSDYLPFRSPHNTVVYTGTHDNTTTEDWQRSADPKQGAFARRYLGVPPGDSVTPAMVRAAMESVADTCIIPMQDYLGLGAEARINTPGTMGDNWCWRMLPGTADRKLAAKIRALTKMYGRI